MFFNNFFGFVRVLGAGSAYCMVSSFHIPLRTSITFPWLCPRLVLAVLFPPFDFLVTSSTHMFVGRRKNFVRLFAFWIMLVGEFILMPRYMSLFLLFLIVAVCLWHDGAVTLTARRAKIESREVLKERKLFAFCWLPHAFAQ